MKKRVFSGIQPTGNIHIGNYLAAMKHWAAIQDEYDCIYCLVDLHGITVPQDPVILKSKTREVAGLLFAVGIDPERSFVFVQSAISAHSELAWILNCFTPMGWLHRMTQFKEKSEKRRQKVSVGLFDYPVLMAADILLYDTHVVPVGEDQKQHVEFTRDLAQRFNSIYGEIFVLPEPLIPKTGARIMGLDDPQKKMSKSDEDSDHSIMLLDSPDSIRSKIMKAKTDSLREIRFDEKRPEIHNLLTIYHLFTGSDRKAIENRFEGKGYADLKKELAEVIIEGLRPIRSRYEDLTADETHIDSLLEKGAERIRPTAQKVLGKVKESVGLG